MQLYIKHNNIYSGLQNLLPCFIIKLKASSDEFKKCIDFYKSYLPNFDTVIENFTLLALLHTVKSNELRQGIIL